MCVRCYSTVLQRAVATPGEQVVPAGTELNFLLIFLNV